MMARSPARVSAILAVFNGEAYLREAIDSVLAELAAEDELIVVDDGSTDGTPALLALYGGRVRVHRQENAGQAAAYVAGIAMAGGEFLAFNDADDLWVAGRLRRQLAVLAEDAAVDGVFGMSEQFVSPELDDDTRARLAPPQTLLVGQVAACLMVRRASFERVGGFDPALRYAHFHDWLHRAHLAGLTLAGIEQPVHRRRLHPGNTGRTQRAARDAELMRLLHRQIAARRAAQGKA